MTSTSPYCYLPIARLPSGSGSIIALLEYSKTHEKASNFIICVWRLYCVMCVSAQSLHRLSDTNIQHF